MYASRAAARDTVGLPLPDGERQDIGRIAARAVDVLGRAAYETLFAGGGEPADQFLGQGDSS
ncbi:hypothetical protein [Streptomyces cyaneofuscatus]|uniref:hypothetical protein n=1 Tax=Streptomyces cyaneofuscatus TaxID=66883 RepID=UPI00378F9550